MQRFLKKPIAIRPMTLDDVDDAATILAGAKLCPKKDARKRISFYIQLPNSYCLVAENGPEVIGIALSIYTGFHLYLSHIGVLESHRRRGVVSTLHAELLERAVQLGARGIIADAIASSEAFFRKLSYRAPGAIFLVHDVK